MCLSYCHTIITDEDESKKLIYNASSPDELALVNLARYCGWKFLGITEDNKMRVFVNEDGIEYIYQLLYVLEFNSDRKRMSIILRDDQGQFVLYCKGADSIIADRLNRNTTDQVTLTTTW